MEILYEREKGDVASIYVDAYVREQHEKTAEATEHAVEQGAAITDHVRPDLPSVTVEGVISNQPVDVPKSHMGGVTGSVQFGALQFSGEFDRVREVDLEIRRLMDEAVLVRIATSLVEYEDMIIRSYAVSRDATNANALFFTMTAKQIRIASTEDVELPDPVDPRSRNQRNRGNQPTEEAAEEEVDRSALQGLRSFFGGGEGVRVP